MTTTMITPAPATTTSAVRIGRFEDLDALAHVRHVSTLRDGSATTLEDSYAAVSAQLRDPDGRVLVATDDDRPVASAFVRTDTFTTVLRDIFRIEQREHLTRELVAAAVRLATQWECRSISWRMLATDHASLRVAVAHEFVVTGAVVIDSAPMLLTTQRFLDPAVSAAPGRVEVIRLPEGLAAAARDDVRRRLLGLARDPAVAVIVLDGREIDTMSPVALGVLVAVARIARERGGHVHIDSPSPRLERALRLAGVTPQDLTRHRR